MSDVIPPSVKADKAEFDAMRMNYAQALQEIERLQRALRYEENRFGRIGTHGPDCWKWGPSHYECALRHIESI